MVAELKPVEATPLPLLMEPDRPAQIDHWTVGWRRVKGEIARFHLHDEQGAIVQHVIVRYLVHGIPRQQIASEVCFSERQVQAWIGGRAWGAYGGPVRRALASLGISMGKGGVGPSKSGYGRNTQVAAACLDLLADVQWHMDDDWPRAREIKELSRLLTAGREPLG